MDYKKDFCEHTDCPEHPNNYKDDCGLISHHDANEMLSNTIEDVIRNAAKVVVEINGIKIPLACTICSNHKQIDMKTFMKRNLAKKELNK